MGVTQHLYRAARWGVGEVWLDGDVLVLHELAGSVPGLDEDGMPQDARSPARVPYVDATPRVPSDVGGAAQHRTRATRSHPPKGGGGAPTGTVARPVSRKSAALATDLCRRFAAQLEGERVDYRDVRVDEALLTDLGRSLLHALRRVPWGEVVTYGELAALAGSPRAARAAGSFCAECQWSLVVPCHRVVAASGIGGYGDDGVEVKRRLLALEGVML